MSNAINLDKNNKVNLKVIETGINYLINLITNSDNKKYYFDILSGQKLEIPKITSNAKKQLANKHPISSLYEYGTQLFEDDKNSGKDDFILEVPSDAADNLLSILDLYRNYIKTYYIDNNSNQDIKAIAIGHYNMIINTMKILQKCLDTTNSNNDEDNSINISNLSNNDLVIHTAIGFIKDVFNVNKYNRNCIYKDYLMKYRMDFPIDPVMPHDKYVHELIDIDAEIINNLDTDNKIKWTNYKATCVYSAITTYRHVLKLIYDSNVYNPHRVKHAMNMTDNTINYMNQLANINYYTYGINKETTASDITDSDKVYLDELFNSNKVHKDLRDHSQNSNQSNQDAHISEDNVKDNLNSSNQKQSSSVQNIINKIKLLTNLDGIKKLPLNGKINLSETMNKLRILCSRLSNLTFHYIYFICTVTDKPEMYISLNDVYNYDHTDLKNYNNVLANSENKDYGPESKEELQAVTDDPHVTPRTGSYYIKVILADGRSYRRNLRPDDIIMTAKRIIKYYNQYKNKK